MDSNYISNHMQCSWQDKILCMETVKKMLCLAETARCNGLLKLQEVVLEEEYSRPAFIEIGVEMIVDGRDPQIVKDVLDHYMLSSQLTNKEFLENLIVCQAILAMQQGEHPRMVEERLCSLFGIDFMEEFKKQTEQEELLLEMDDFFLQNQERLDSFDKTDLLDFIPKVMDNNGIQRILREVPMMSLEYALLGCKQSIVNMFVKNLSKRNQKLFFADLQNITKLDKIVIEKNQKEILKIIKKLSHSGEILFFSYSNSRVLTQNVIDQLIREML